MKQLELYLVKQSKLQFERVDNLLDLLLSEIKSDGLKDLIDEMKSEIESEISRLDFVLDAND
jgi:ferritin-like metal-binding protein YciE